MTKQHSEKGTLHAARTQGGGSEINGPKTKPKQVNLRALDSKLYTLALTFCRQQWPHLELFHEFDMSSSGYALFSDRMAQTVPFILKSHIRYGCSTSQRTKRDQYAFVDFQGEHVPCQIVHHLILSVADEDPLFCSVVRRFVADEQLPALPWDL